MGYLTYYTMEIYKADKFPGTDGILSYAEERKVLAASKVAVAKDIAFENFEDDCIKWYDHQADLDAVSKEMEDYVFVLYGDGEESDDKWKVVFHKGTHIGVSKESYYPPINLSKIGLTDPDDYTPPVVKPINEYFWNKE